MHLVWGGDIAAAILWKVFPGDEVVALGDSLSFGPAVRSWLPETWGRIRGNYWRSLMESNGEVFVDDMERLIEAVERRDAASVVVHWVGGSLDELLGLAWVVATLRAREVPWDRIKCVFLESVHSEGAMISRIPADTLARQYLSGRELSEAERGLCGHIWDAWTADDPRELWSVSAVPGATLGGRIPRLSLLRSRYPALSSGLSGLDTEILEACGSNGAAIGDVIVRLMTREEHAESGAVGDGIVVGRLLKLARPNQASPILRVDGDPGKAMRRAVSVTAYGREVLAGRANQVDENGIDEWIGGVHLQAPPGPVWYRDGEVLIRR